MRLFRFLLILCILLGGSYLTACQKKHSAKKEVDQFVQKIAEASKTANQLNTSTDAAVAPVTFQAANLRDPFELPASVKTGKEYPNTILKDKALDSLKLVGVVIDPHERAALFRTNDGKLYKINEGLRVGLQQALLSQITRNEVIFIIEVQTGLGTESHKVVMTMQEPKQ